MLPHQKHSPTSLQAALDFEGRALAARHRVFLAIQALGEATDEEVQNLLHMNPNTQRPRRVELVRAGLVEDSGRTRQTKSETKAVIWVVAQGAEYQEALFKDRQERVVLRGLAKAVAEIERALPDGKRSVEVRELLDRLHGEAEKEFFDLDDFLSGL